MKLLLTGDWHLTDIAPARRIDDYAATIFNKLVQIGNIAVAQECSYILQPGDFFDAFRVSEELKVAVIKLTRMWEDQGIRIITIPGQHDMRYRDFDLKNTSLGVLQASNTLTVLPIGKTGAQWFINTPSDHVKIFGCPYGSEIPELTPKNKSDFNILMIHAMITKKGPLWPGQTDYTSGLALLKKQPYDLIVSGDNHKSFVVEQGCQSLINCGSLMRSSIAQTEHEPHVWVYDTVTRKKTCHYLKIKKVSEVFDSIIIEGREIDVVLDGANEFFAGIRNVESHEFNYFEMVDMYVKGKVKEIPKGTQEVIKEVIQAITEQSTGV